MNSVREVLCLNTDLPPTKQQRATKKQKELPDQMVNQREGSAVSEHRSSTHREAESRPKSKETYRILDREHHKLNNHTQFKTTILEKDCTINKLTIQQETHVQLTPNPNTTAAKHNRSAILFQAVLRAPRSTSFVRGIRTDSGRICRLIALREGKAFHRCSALRTSGPEGLGPTAHPTNPHYCLISGYIECKSKVW